MKPCFPRFNRHENAIKDVVESESKNPGFQEKRKKPKIKNSKKPEALTKKDPTKEILDLLTPF